MAWIHETSGRPARWGMLAIAALLLIAAVLGFCLGQDVTQQVVGPVVVLAGAGLFASLAVGERGQSLSIDAGRLRWSWKRGTRAVRADVALDELRELHREAEPPVVRDGQPERRRLQQIFVVLADGRRRLLPPSLLRNWEAFVRELRAVRPDLKVTERETDSFTAAEA